MMFNHIKFLFSPDSQEKSGSEDVVVKSNNENGFDYDNGEVILDVRHLKQYFKFGKGAFKYNKAVHDVSFKVYKGEVFGLVGESGCGKTTTGRSIIKLYQITSGDVWFKGTRIAAGTRWNEKEIKFTKIRLKNQLKKNKIDQSEELSSLYQDYQEKFNDIFVIQKIKKEVEEHGELYESKSTYLQKYNEIIEKYKLMNEEMISKANEIIRVQRQKIREAKHDNRYCDKDMINLEKEKIKEKYAEILAKVASKSELTPEEEEKYQAFKAEIKKASHASITSKIQMIFQDPIASLNPRMTVRDIISEGLVIQGCKDKEFINNEVNRVLELVGLVPEHANRYPHEFSGGQRQRIGIARAIIMNPELIIADEPVSALDVSIQAQVINLLNDLRNNLGLTILFIAHNLSVVKYFCDRIAVMYFGNLVELATSDELFAHPLHPYTKSLLSAVPHPDPNIEKNRQRIVYDGSLEHDYSEQKPTLREITKGHFVLCNDEEEKKYLEEIKKGKSIYAK